MSTTVTYKGSTLTTVENETKILSTSGTWLEDDIVVTDSSSASSVGVFYVYHSSNCKIERINIPNSDWRFDLTSIVPTGYLYGGYFSAYANASKAFTYEDLENETFTEENGRFFWEDEEGTPYNASKANKWSVSNCYTDVGLSLNPTVNQVYYLKEVPNDYLRPHLFKLFSGDHLLVGLLATINFDDNIYNGSIMDPIIVSKRLVLRMAINGTSYTAKTTFDGKVYPDKTIQVPRGYMVGASDTNPSYGFVDLSKYSVGDTISFSTSWITKDGVRVYGAVDGLIDFGDFSDSPTGINVTYSVRVGKKVAVYDDVSPLAHLEITPSSSTQTYSGTANYNGFSDVEVKPIPSQYIIPSGTKSINANGTGIDVTNYASVDVAVPGSSPNLQAKTNISPTESSQTITADSGYDGLSSVQINAISSTYVGSGITRRSSTDLTASGATVTAPAGYYQSEATKTVASGTEGTPTATKGTVSNHAVSVTPSVTNSAGYISGGTKTGTSVSVSASELVSGTLSITSSGTKDVTNYASASVAAGTEGTPSATKGTVSNHSVSVTPSVTNTAGYISGGTKTGTAVTVQASELVSGSETKTANGTYDVTNLASLVVDVPFVTYYTGSTEPASSLGQNGDIYLQTS